MQFTSAILFLYTHDFVVDKNINEVLVRSSWTSWNTSSFVSPLLPPSLNVIFSAAVVVHVEYDPVLPLSDHAPSE